MTTNSRKGDAFRSYLEMPTTFVKLGRQEPNLMIGEPGLLACRAAREPYRLERLVRVWIALPQEVRENVIRLYDNLGLLTVVLRQMNHMSAVTIERAWQAEDEYLIEIYDRELRLRLTSTHAV